MVQGPHCRPLYIPARGEQFSKAAISTLDSTRDLALALEVVVFLLQLTDLIQHLLRTHLLLVELSRPHNPQVRFLPKREAVFTDPQLPRNLRLGLAAVNHQLHRFAFKLFFVPFLNFLFFHGLSHFTLSFPVRQIGGASC